MSLDSKPHSRLRAAVMGTPAEAELDRLEEQLEALRKAVRKGLAFAEACESWPSTFLEKAHYREEVESMRAALNPAPEPDCYEGNVAANIAGGRYPAREPESVTVHWDEHGQMQPGPAFKDTDPASEPKEV